MDRDELINLVKHEIMEAVKARIDETYAKSVDEVNFSSHDDDRKSNRRGLHNRRMSRNGRTKVDRDGTSYSSAGRRKSDEPGKHPDRSQYTGRRKFDLKELGEESALPEELTSNDYGAGRRKKKDPDNKFHQKLGRRDPDTITTDRRGKVSRRQTDPKDTNPPDVGSGRRKSSSNSFDIKPNEPTVYRSGRRKSVVNKVTFGNRRADDLPRRKFPRTGTGMDERSLTKGEESEKERFLQALKKRAPDLQKKYGAKWKDVMYAIAVKKAKESPES